MIVQESYSHALEQGTLVRHRPSPTQTCTRGSGEIRIHNSFNEVRECNYGAWVRRRVGSVDWKTDTHTGRPRGLGKAFCTYLKETNNVDAKIGVSWPPHQLYI